MHFVEEANRMLQLFRKWAYRMYVHRYFSGTARRSCRLIVDSRIIWRSTVVANDKCLHSTYRHAKTEGEKERKKESKTLVLTRLTEITWLLNCLPSLEATKLLFLLYAISAVSTHKMIYPSWRNIFNNAFERISRNWLAQISTIFFQCTHTTIADNT